ncbi:hypothetical protein CLV59_105323 [Chitinophaga dinghuensis]|uniref:Uncharacterized protein n=1 Tax=Chitinophaga dinghuensis TaxID=1539050 RepID=A0A327VZ82_9BACT|nr:hypothetical protein [Chitinophaga dinghuensis]RAJ80215.1 hypothetical protein CLV59_105323 [Chitinophaga dinghuensis]
MNLANSYNTQETKALRVFTVASVIASLVLPFTYNIVMWEQTLKLLFLAMLFLGMTTYFLLREKFLSATYMLVCYINLLLIYNVWLTDFSNQVIFLSGFAVAVSVLANHKMKHKGICLIISIVTLNVLCLSYQHIPVRHPSPLVFSVVGLTLMQLLNLVSLILWAQSRRYIENE